MSARRRAYRHLRGGGRKSSQSRERCDVHHLGQSREREHTSVRVAYDRAEGVVHTPPAQPGEYSQERDAAEAYRLGAEPLEPQRILNKEFLGLSLIGLIAAERVAVGNVGVPG